MFTCLPHGINWIGSLPQKTIFFIVEILFVFFFNFKISDGKLSVEKSVRFMSQMAQGNSELVRIVREISEECAPLTDSDR